MLPVTAGHALTGMVERGRTPDSDSSALCGYPA
jgi:hypothetical protein